jgi:hypothetical protein
VTDKGSRSADSRRPTSRSSTTASRSGSIWSASEQIPLNVILALDMSDSVAKRAARSFAHRRTRAVERLKPEDQAAFLTFRRDVTLGADLTARAAMRCGARPRRTVRRDRARRRHASAIVVGESDVGRALLIVFSDGLDTSSWLSSESVLDTAKRSDVVATPSPSAASKRSSSAT